MTAVYLCHHLYELDKPLSYVTEMYCNNVEQTKIWPILHLQTYMYRYIIICVIVCEKAAHVAGQCNLLFTNQKEKVLVQMSELSQIQEILVAKEAQVKKMETEAALVEGEVQKASLKMGRVSELIENYTVSVILDVEQTHKMKPVFLCFFIQLLWPWVQCYSICKDFNL